MTQKQIKIIKDWIKFGIAIGCVVFFVLFFLFSLWSPIKTNQSVVIERGATISSVAKYLRENRIIKSKRLFALSVRLNGGKIKTGEYEFKAGDGVWIIADALTKGRVAMAVITIPEGYTIKQTKTMLKNMSGLTGDVDCNKNLPVCKLQDGDIFPDTYYVARGTSRLAVLDLAYRTMLDVKKSFENEKLPKPLKNWNEVITLASIVQKETPIVREMPIVAGVYLNRLNRNMRLQACPTVVYALTKAEGDMHGKPLLSEHLKINSPYNTYVNNGLPPRPIANVGRDAIRSVLRPARTDYLFFVADGRGGHNFSKDYSEHQKNHDAWRKIKKQINNH